MKIFKLLFIALVLSSCSANYHLNKYIDKGGEFKNDTSIINTVDTTIQEIVKPEVKVDEGYQIYCNELGKLVINLQDENGKLKNYKPQVVTKERLVYKTKIDTMFNGSVLLKVEATCAAEIDSMVLILNTYEETISEAAITIKKGKDKLSFYDKTINILILAAISLLLILLFKIFKK